MTKTTIVISAVNLRKGGTLTILRQCLEYLSGVAMEKSYRVVALVHKQELADYPNIEYIEMPWTIQGWGKRLWAEYVTMGKISREIGNVDLWLSLHDTTPRVEARRQAVYCHTSFPFFKVNWGDLKFDPKIPIFGVLTKYVYKAFQRRNRFIIVQQEWLRRAFMKTYGLPLEKVVLSRADAPSAYSPDTLVPKQGPSAGKKYTFFYASTADAHKDFQTLCRATELLGKKVDPSRFEVILTVSGTENKYAQYLYKEWGQTPSLRFAGLMDKPTLYAHYELADCFVFPSRIETWGLPISEYMQVHEGKRPIILPNLAYAHETSLGAKQVAFFESGDAQQLATLMAQAIEGDYKAFAPRPEPQMAEEPTAQGWAQLFDVLLAGL